MNSLFYTITRKIHLYTSLSIILLLLMYLATSYMMIHHSWFQRGDNQEHISRIKINPVELSDNSWHEFLKNNGIKGRLVRENSSTSGDLVRQYASPGNNYKITIFKSINEVEIKYSRKSMADTMIGFHRLSGFGGPIQYNLYALLLDVVGVSLILFAVTGVILWLRLSKHNIIAWVILISGFAYVSMVIGYLLLV